MAANEDVREFHPGFDRTGERKSFREIKHYRRRKRWRGQGIRRRQSRTDPQLFEETLRTDIFGCYNFLHAALPHLRKSRGVVAALVTPAIRRYAVKDVLSASPKAAIEALVRGIAAEEGRFGVRANCVGVGVIEDGMYHKLIETGDFDERFQQATRDTVALRRLGAAQDIANAVEFLVSDRAAYIAGQTLMVDGGYAV